MSESSTSAQPIRVGINGLGRSGWNIHARLLEPLSDKFTVVACLDPKEERRREAAERFGCKTYVDYGEMLKDDAIDLMVVATPSHLHAEGALQAMRAGKDIVCEKPMASSLADADRMIAASKETGKLLAIFQSRRYAADFQKVQEVIASGKLGRIVQISLKFHGFSRRWDWQTLQKYGGGSLNNTGPHIVDWAVEFLHEKEPEVWCHLDRTLTLGDADDHVKLVLRAPGEPVVDIELTSACAYGQDTWLVMGTKGTLAGKASEFKWRYIDETKQPPREIDEEPTPDRSYNRDELVWEQEETWKAEDYKGPGIEGFYLDLYETLRNGAPLVITPESVRVQMGILEKCHAQNPLDAKS